jgi:hypothetical protein
VRRASKGSRRLQPNPIRALRHHYLLHHQNTTTCKHYCKTSFPSASAAPPSALPLFLNPRHHSCLQDTYTRHTLHVDLVVAYTQRPPPFHSQEHIPL